MRKDLFLEKLESAKGEISAAEGELEMVIRNIRLESRAEKTKISAVLEDAFAKLKAARSSLVELENLVKSPGD